MQVARTNIYDFLSKSETEFKIPIYQRPYSWDNKNIKDFWRDVENTLNQSRPHYFGSILYFSKEKKFQRLVAGKNPQVYTIVDGQQRITTVMLMLVAIYHLAQRTSGILAKDPEWVNNTFLLNIKSQKLKLRTAATDDEHFTSIIKRKSLQPKSQSSQSYLHEAYHFFYNKLMRVSDLNRYIDSLSRLEIVSMQLDAKDDDQQKIFESINATGKRLTEGDKIRNFALMLKSQEDSNYVYQEYWRKIERRLTRGKDVDIHNFFRNYLISTLSKPIKDDDVYTEFKKHFRVKNPIIDSSKKEKMRRQLDDFYSDILRNLERYVFLKFDSRMNTAASGYAKFNDEAFRIWYLGIKVVWPFFMNVLKKYDNEELSEKEVRSVFKITESHLIKKIVSSGSARGLENIYYAMNSKAEEYHRTVIESQSYVDVYRYRLENDDTIPTPEKLKVGIKENDMYTGTSTRRYLEFILTSIEEKQSGSDSKLLRAFADKKSDYSIEHIIPKELNPDWEKELGQKPRDTQKKWINTLANITLTRQNTAMSNLNFSKKKDYLAQESLSLDKVILDCESWNEDSLEKRVQWWFQAIGSLWQ